MPESQRPRVAFSLSVNRKHIRDALRQIKKVKGLTSQSAIFTFKQHNLHIDLGSCSFTADAEGIWRGQVRVPIEFIQGLAKEPPTGDGPIAVSCDGEFLHVDAHRTKCRWDRLCYPRITLPLGTSLVEILSLPKRFSKEDIRRADLEETVAEAESQAMRLIEKATKTLLPLRFTSDDLERVLEEKVTAIARTDAG